MKYLTTEPIDVDQLQRQLSAPHLGGVVTFVGLVRNHHQDRPVARLDYSAYEPMAESMMARIVAEAEGQWPVVVAARHRLGALEIGDVAVAIVTAAAHRDEAFLACRYLIEEIKTRVPIWKRETFSDGTVIWVDPTANLPAGVPEPAE